MCDIKKLWNLICLTAFFVTAALPLRAEQAHVAVAANFLKPAQELKKLFEAQTGHTIILSIGSTGQLYAQIIQGAPYDVFLAADKRRPTLLIQRGLALENSQFTYALGRLVLFSRHVSEPITQQALTSLNGGKLALANPKTAPYGAAAVQTLKALNLYEKFEPHFVRGSNVAQTYQFTDTGNTTMGFVALAQVISEPERAYWVIPQQLYDPIAQDAVLLKHAQANVAATDFLLFLRNKDTREQIIQYGFGMQSLTEE